MGTAGDVNGDGFSDVVVSARGYDNGQIDEGRVYVYHGSATGLGASASWTAESDQATSFFGWCVGPAGDVNGDGFSDVIVGAYRYDNGQTDEGRAYVYNGSAAGLATGAAWISESNQAGANFGLSVGTAGDVNGDGFSDVITGAPSYDNGQTDEGRAFVYHGSAGGLALSAGWTAESDQMAARFGWSVGTAGDVNGDGYSDVIIGADAYDNGQTDEGRAFVYHGSAGGLALSPSWTAESNQPEAGFGISVGTAGDVNGDGYSDVIVGAQRYEVGQLDEGRAYVYHGSASGLAMSPAWTARSNQANARFGMSVGTAGDVNGDGYSDVIVGAFYYDNGEEDEGRAYVYHGSAGGLRQNPAWTAESNQTGASFGYSVAAAGDVNGDGFSDAIVGAYAYDNELTDVGRAYVYHGSVGGLGLDPAWTAESNQATAYFGHSVATAGDVNGDGFSDIIVGADRYDNGQNNEGRAYVYHGSADGLGLDPAWTAESNQATAYFGHSVATAGDVNGDGFSDVMVGAPYFDNGQTDEGRALEYHGSAEGLAATPVWTAESDQASADFGISVATAGDVNGDGFSDVIVGAYWYTNDQTYEGRAFLYYGNVGDGLHRSARQVRTDDSAPIAPLGFSGSPDFDSFLLRVVGRTPAGRGNVRLEYEVKPLGVLFDGSALEFGPMRDTGTPGGSGSVVDLTEMVSGLAINTQYHWRLRTATDSPFFPRSPWLSLPYNCMTEADLRVGGTLVGIENERFVARAPLLDRATPNPFGSTTRFTYTLPQRGPVHLAVYNVAGQRVALLRDGDEDAGLHLVNWDGRGTHGSQLASGVYFVQIRFRDQKDVRKVVLAR